MLLPDKLHSKSSRYGFLEKVFNLSIGCIRGEGRGRARIFGNFAWTGVLFEDPEFVQKSWFALMITLGPIIQPVFQPVTVKISFLGLWNQRC